jgi:hypothetical protein
MSDLDLYTKNLASYENDISLIYDSNAPLYVRRKMLSTIKTKYDQLVMDLLAMYPERSLDLDYYKINGRLPTPPLQCSFIDKNGNLVYDMEKD